jgi:hypothetical protein
VLLALVGLLAGCASSRGRIEDGRLYVHLCDAMPEDDQLAWGEAAGDINAELGEPVLWVGHGPPIGCNTVDVCPSSAVREGAETHGGECVITVRYAPGAAHEASTETLRNIAMIERALSLLKNADFMAEQGAATRLFWIGRASFLLQLDGVGTCRRAWGSPS